MSLTYFTFLKQEFCNNILIRAIQQFKRLAVECLKKTPGLCLMQIIKTRLAALLLFQECQVWIKQLV